MNLFSDITEDFCNDTSKCLDSGIEAGKIFGKLIDDYKKKAGPAKRKRWENE